MAEINGEEKRIGVSGEQIEEVVGKMPAVEADVKANKQNISAMQADVSKHTEDIAKNTADIEKKANADEVYSKEETDNAITAKVAEIVSGAPKEFDTLKEMSDWLTEHSDSAATMNSAIQENTKAIADNATAIEGNTADIEQNKSDISLLNTNKMGFEYGYAYASNASKVGWFKLAKFSCPAMGSTVRRATFFVTGLGAGNTGILNISATSVSGTTAGIGALACSWAYNQLTTGGGKYITNLPVEDYKAIANLDGNMIRVELWCRISNPYFVVKTRLLNFESRTDFLPLSEVELYPSATPVTDEPIGDVEKISSYTLRAELDKLTERITALETAAGITSE